MINRLKILFQRLTLFDWLIILVVLSGLIFLSQMIFKQESWRQVQVKITRPEWWFGETKAPYYWMADKINKGDKQYDSLGREIAEVLEVKSYEWGGNTRVMYLTLNVKTDYDSRKKQLKFNHKILAVGKPIDLSFSTFGTQALVTYIEGIPDNRKWGEKIVEMKLMEWSDKYPESTGVLPWRADTVKAGDQVKDLSGNVVADILEKKEKPADKVVQLSNGQLKVTSDPIRKDVFLTVKMKTFEENGVDYFLDDYKVKVGQAIMLTLPQIDIWPEITKIIK